MIPDLSRYAYPLTWDSFERGFPLFYDQMQPDAAERYNNSTHARYICVQIQVAAPDNDLAPEVGQVFRRRETRSTP